MTYRVVFFGTPNGEDPSLTFASWDEADRFGFEAMLDGMPADGYRIETEGAKP